MNPFRLQKPLITRSGQPLHFRGRRPHQGIADGQAVIRRIVEHNQPNGIAFAIAEFLLVAVVAALLAAGYARQGQAVAAVLALGTALNSLVVVAFGIVAWRRGERGTPLSVVFSRSGRRDLTRAHPRLMSDTMIVAITALVPFVLLAATLAEYAWTSLKGT
jgi:hypothetical protein